MTGKVPDNGREYRETTHSVDTRIENVTRRGRRGLGGWWWPALLVVPLLLAGLTSLVSHKGVETDLAKRSEAALADAGISGATVAFRGRDGKVTLSEGDAANAKSIVEKVNGVRVVNVSGGGATAAPAPSATSEPSASPEPASPSPTAGNGPNFSIASSADGKTVTVKAEVPDEAAKTALIQAVKTANPDATVDDQVTVVSGAGALPSDAINALAASLKGSSGVTITGTGNAITLTGAVESEAIKTSAGTAAQALNPSATVDNQLTVAASGSGSGSVSADCATVNKEVAATLKANPIEFAVNSANMLPASATEVNNVASKLKDCLGADGGATGLTVEGHTDSDGSDKLNQALSQRRADAVKAALVKAGLPGDKITSTGFGESKPIASNDTAAGKAQNRRVVIQLT